MLMTMSKLSVELHNEQPHLLGGDPLHQLGVEVLKLEAEAAGGEVVEPGEELPGNP